MTFDTIQMETSLLNGPGYSALLVEYGLEINGQKFHPELRLDLTAIVKSCQWSGELDIFTCGCGQPECAGIFQGIEVGHTDDAITWKCPNPLSVSQQMPDLWENGVTTFENFAFASDQYIAAVDAGIKRIKSLVVSAPRPIEFPVHGVELKQVMALETRPFSTHTIASDRRVIARQVVVDAYDGFVTVDGVGYQMGDLNLPDELMAQYSTWSALRVFPTHEAELGQYVTYLLAGRVFCRELRKYIGRRTAVQFKYRPPDVYNSVAWEVLESIR
jgi:hypothetical protein